MRVGGVLAAVVLGLIPAVGVAGPIDLTAVITDPATGKPIPNLQTQRPGLAVLFPFEVDGHPFAKGDLITDADAVGKVQAYLTAIGKTAYVGSPDPDCAKCAPVTVGWVIAQALNASLCTATPTRAKSSYCDPDEQKAEDDLSIMLARHNLAMQIQGYGGKAPGDEPTPMTSLVLGPQSVAKIKTLIAGRFSPPLVQAPAPDVIEQSWRAIDPTFKPEVWGQK
jgi:hypothetical protein